MGSIEEALRKIFFPALFWGEEGDADFRKSLGHIIKRISLGIPDPWSSAESLYNISKVAIGELVSSILGGTSLNYICRKACVRGATVGTTEE